MKFFIFNDFFTFGHFSDIKILTQFKTTQNDAKTKAGI